MTDPDPNEREREVESHSPRDRSVTILCSECGEVLECRDPEALIRALHLTKACTLRTLFGSD